MIGYGVKYVMKKRYLISVILLLPSLSILLYIVFYITNTINNKP